MRNSLRTVVTNRLFLGFRGERSHSFGQTDGGKPRSPRLSFVLVVFFTLVSSFGVARLLATLMVSPPGLSPLPGEVVGVSDAPAPPHRVRRASPKVFDAVTFKKTIIDNNLFRPLGWTPPRPIEPYRLLGTIIPTDAKTPPKAVIQNIVRNQTHIVTIGDTLDSNTYVTNIQTKHVTLKKNGQPRQLTLKSSFLLRR